MASAIENTSRPQWFSCDIGVRKKPSAERGPKRSARSDSRTPATMAGVRQPRPLTVFPARPAPTWRNAPRVRPAAPTDRVRRGAANAEHSDPRAHAKTNFGDPSHLPRRMARARAEGPPTSSRLLRPSSWGRPRSARRTVAPGARPIEGVHAELVHLLHFGDPARVHPVGVVVGGLPTSGIHSLPSSMSRAMRLARAQASSSVTTSGMPSQAKVNWQALWRSAF